MFNTIGNQISKIRFSIEKRSLLLLRLSVGIIFLWFGLVKFLDGSAAESIATETISWLTLDTIDKTLSLYLLAVLECIIGLSLLTKKALNVIIPLMYLQMCGTILPLFIFPDKTWIDIGKPSLEGQYIIKNIVFIASGILLGAAAHGGKLILHPEIAKAARHKEKQVEENE